MIPCKKTSLSTTVGLTAAGALVGILTLALPSHVGAEEIDLAAAMTRARSEARPVAAARSRLEASESRLRQARGARLPSVKVEETWISTDSPADAFGLLLNQKRFSFTDFVSGDPNNPDRLETATTRFELDLPLYTGGEIASRIQQARLSAAAAGDQVAWTADGAALAAAEAYIRLAQARENVALLEGSLDTVRAHVATARSYVDQGMLVSSELLRAEVEQSRIEDLLSTARGQAKVAEANLSFRLAADAGTSWELGPLASPAPLEGDLSTWLAGVDERKDLDSARQRVEAAALEARVARAARLPRVGLVVRHDLVDDRLFGTHGDSTSVIAQGSIEVFSGGRHRAAAAAARADAAAAAEELAHAAEGARLEVRQAYERAVAARERYHTSRAALDAAREAERITEERFGKGVVKMIDLLDASTARREAETRELVARTEAYLATLELTVRAGRSPETALAGRAPDGHGKASDR